LASDDDDDNGWGRRATIAGTTMTVVMVVVVVVMIVIDDSTPTQYVPSFILQRHGFFVHTNKIHYIHVYSGFGRR
jgi:hypothetical protein